MNIRHYTQKDFEDCISIFRSNMPDFLDPSEEEEFTQYLRDEPETYFVMFDSNKVKACGGYYVDEKKGIAGLSWGMVHRQFHKIGFGKQLVEFRLQKLHTDFPGVDVLLNTSQHTYRFFERFGFEVENITPDGYGVGLDRYDMRLKSTAFQS